MIQFLTLFTVHHKVVFARNFFSFIVVLFGFGDVFVAGFDDDLVVSVGEELEPFGAGGLEVILLVVDIFDQHFLSLFPLRPGIGLHPQFVFKRVFVDEGLGLVRTFVADAQHFQVLPLLSPVLLGLLQRQIQVVRQ